MIKPEDITEIVFFLECIHYYEKDPEYDGLESLWQMFERFKEYKNAEHFGDCTDDPCPCMRCHYDLVFQQAQAIATWLINKELV